MALLRPYGLVSLLVLTAGSVAFGACGPAPTHPSSLVNAGGAYGSGGHTSQGASAGLEAAGQSPGGDAGDGGAAGGEPIGTPLRPLAVYPIQLEADVGCGTVMPDAVLVIRNGGSLALSVTSASANGGYLVKTALPLSIEPDTAAQLLITPPAAKVSAKVGDTSTGTLSFTTNEPGSPTHTVSLSSELLGASLEFLDHSGMALGSALTLTYLDASDCPDTVKYRVHNTGNVAFTLFGPTFPANLGGSTTGASGQSVAPDGFVELMLGGNSAPGGVCTTSGQLTFTTAGAFCGSAPTLNVVWPASPGPTCACSVGQ